MRYALYVVSVLSFAGCATIGSDTLNNARKHISKSKIGCPESEIVLSDQTGDSWTASCRGHKFHCTVYEPVDSKGDTISVTQTCTEELKKAK